MNKRYSIIVIDWFGDCVANTNLSKSQLLEIIPECLKMLVDDYEFQSVTVDFDNSRYEIEVKER